MSKTITFVLAIAIAWSTFSDSDALSMDLRQYNWKKRLLLIFAPDGGNSHLRSLESDIAAQPGEILERVNASGHAHLSSTEVGGRVAIRMAFLSHRTTDAIVDRALQAIADAASR